MMSSQLPYANPESINAWSKFAKEIGVPVFILSLIVLGMSFAGYKSACWIGEKILLPTFEDNKALVATQTESNKAMMVSNEAMVSSLKTLTDSLQSQTNHWEKMSNDIEAIRKATDHALKEMTGGAENKN